MHGQTLSNTRREATRRAVQAVVRLAVDPTAKEAAARANDIVNNLGAVSDLQAWQSVHALEHMVVARGLTAVEQVTR
jgi:hypothetical protein